MSHSTTYTLELADTANSKIYTYSIASIGQGTFDYEPVARNALLNNLKALLSENYDAVEAKIITDSAVSFKLGSFELKRIAHGCMDPEVRRMQTLRTDITESTDVSSHRKTAMKLCATSTVDGEIITDAPPTCTPEETLVTIHRKDAERQKKLEISYEAIALYVGGPYLGDHAKTQSIQNPALNTLLNTAIPVLPDRMPMDESSIADSRVINNGHAIFYTDNSVLTTAHTVVGFSETHDAKTGKPIFVAATDARSNHYGNENLAVFSATGFAQVVLATKAAQFVSNIPIVGNIVKSAVKGGTPGPYFELALHPVQVDSETTEIQILFRGSCFPRMLLNISVTLPGIKISESTVRSYALYVDPTPFDSAVNGAAYEKLFTAESFEVVSSIKINNKGEILSYDYSSLADKPALLQSLQACSNPKDAEGFLYMNRMIASNFVQGCLLGNSYSQLRAQPKLVSKLFRRGSKRGLFGDIAAMANGLCQIHRESPVVTKDIAHHCLIGPSYKDLVVSLQINNHCVTRLDLEEIIKIYKKTLDAGIELINSSNSISLQMKLELATLNVRYVKILNESMDVLFENQKFASTLDEKSRKIRHKQVKGIMRNTVGNIDALCSMLLNMLSKGNLSASVNEVLHHMLSDGFGVRQMLANYYTQRVLFLQSMSDESVIESELLSGQSQKINELLFLFNPIIKPVFMEIDGGAYELQSLLEGLFAAPALDYDQESQSSSPQGEEDTQDEPQQSFIVEMKEGETLEDILPPSRLKPNLRSA